MFVKEIYQTFPSLKLQAIRLNRKIPYCYEKFNVETFFYNNSYGLKSPVSHLLNSVINTINAQEFLPKYLIIIPDKDIVDFINYTQRGISQIIGTILDWLIKQIDQTMERKRLLMWESNPGSVEDEEPAIIWVKMLDRPSTKLHILHEKFNKIMEDIIRNKSNTYVIDPNEFLERNMFSRIGDLNLDGKVVNWRTMDNKIKKFDKGEINLFPMENQVAENRGSQEDTVHKVKSTVVVPPMQFLQNRRKDEVRIIQKNNARFY